MRTVTLFVVLVVCGGLVGCGNVSRGTYKTSQYKEGATAFKAGVPVTANPYLKDEISTQRAEWAAGWSDAALETKNTKAESTHK